MEERRAYPRWKVSHRAVYFTDIYPRPNVASILDLSLGGAKIVIPYSLIAGEGLELTIAIRPHAIKCAGKAVYVAWLKKGWMEAGIQFREISDQDRNRLHQYLSLLAGEQQAVS